MKQHRNSIVTLGITSLVLIFSVLCMVILALLTLESSRSDLNMSKRSMEQTEAYYDACTTAADLCSQAEDFLRCTLRQSASEKDYLKTAENLCSRGFFWEENRRILAIDVPFSDSQSLRVELYVLYPQDTEEPLLEIHTWQTISTGNWNPDTRQHVYQNIPE